MIRKPALAALALPILVLGATSSSAWATVQEEDEGEAIYNQIRSGQLACSKVTSSQFELVGEYAMGKMIGSPSAHEAMNERIKARLGEEGEEEAHQYLGARYAGCATGAAPGSTRR